MNDIVKDIKNRYPSVLLECKDGWMTVKFKKQHSEYEYYTYVINIQGLLDNFKDLGEYDYNLKQYLFMQIDRFYRITESDR